jgi:hypothetical protein
MFIQNEILNVAVAIRVIAIAMTKKPLSLPEPATETQGTPHMHQASCLLPCKLHDVRLLYSKYKYQHSLKSNLFKSTIKNIIRKRTKQRE